MPFRFSLRWVAVSIFIISSTLNYLDRNLLPLLAPTILADLHMSKTQYGYLLSVFSLTYAASSLPVGWLLDRFGINRVISAAVGWWSLAAMGHGLVTGSGGLAACRAALGIAESAGVPAVGKNNGFYLKPEERALGAAVNQIGLSLSAVVGSLWISFALVHGWRSPFFINGLLGLAWIPLWLLVSRTIPPQFGKPQRPVQDRVPVTPKLGLLRDKNLMLLILANLLWMNGYSLWQNWITLYLVNVHHITQAQSARYVWIPPLCSNLGGFFGGWLSLRWMRKNLSPLDARRRAVWVSALFSLLALFLPLAPTAAWATAGISLSYFFALAGSVNIYALPIDLYGPERSGLALAALTFAFGVMQAAVSPFIGRMADHQQYGEVVWIATIPLILAAGVLAACKDQNSPSVQEIRS